MTNKKCTYSSIDIASYISYLCNKNKLSCNNTKIQKLLYITYGIYLAIYNRRLTDEQPKLWPYGPVFVNAFKEIKKIGCNNITNPDIEISKEVKDIIEEVINKFGKFSAGALSDWSHEKNSPWDEINKLGCKWNTPIPDSLIKNYFKENFVKLEKNA